ncbi:30S ribosome-binding factor RbfA [Sodalis-like secondary symbiont of Drepanosiphum platanoidis]|uniref:30S ribosome-binding factor RbfA n=1 Tax=Sodalis-like secondary symbiont of Drepanosiphum platanoidis TaxID=2994493 RepID=UPI0034640183
MECYKIRNIKLCQEIKKSISVILQEKISDNRIKYIYVIEVKISRDLSYAKIFINSIKKKNINEMKKKIKILQKASKFIRFFLSKKINIRITPKLYFIYDNSLEKSIKIYSLLKNIKK